MRTLMFCVAALLVAAGPAPAQDRSAVDKARGSLALEAALKKGVAAKAAPPCACPDSGFCTCARTGGRCPCCEAVLPGFTEQRAKALKEKLPLVAFCNCKGTCTSGALTCEGANILGRTTPTILVMRVPRADGVFITEELPATATHDQLVAAVARAKK